MSFMNSYKRLDNLCKDQKRGGITGYIDEMDSRYNGAGIVSGWKMEKWGCMLILIIKTELLIIMSYMKER